ncbi:molybdenum ABC transporter ATP-binding protein [Halotalea alkalilenta]|uniref:ABC transporter domain-containing protein n=1 Tax=Halotalea alkalilenta TaxID=376489 RepID=A0A172YDA6_9GAMM|nr:molybdenum ABC transporter ATP-binding protein [Halotalea alkalilenta]ANF57096.1 hypothetical protein A5892_06135 [Halotalea alkalilenta]
MSEHRAGPVLDLHCAKRLGDFDLELSSILPGQGVSALFGPSGSGKTSLLRLISGLDRPDRGHVRLGGEPLVDVAGRRWVAVHRRRIGVVFQEPRLFPHYRVRGNLCYGLRSDTPSRFDDVVTLLGLDTLLERWPATLSGGEARRVAIGRALLSAPRLLLLDEPLSGLDGSRKGELIDYLQRLAAELALPMVLVSHDPEEVIALADHLLLLERGRVVDEGALPAVLGRLDLEARLDGFDGASLLEATVVEEARGTRLGRLAFDDGQALAALGVDAPVGTKMRLRFAADAVELSPPGAPGTLAARFVAQVPSRRDPGLVEIVVELAGQRLRARVAREAFERLAPAPGAMLRLIPGRPQASRQR